MRPRDVKALEQIAENDPDDLASLAMAKLREIDPTYHWCPDWDYMVICKGHKAEYSCCTCEIIEQ